MCNELGLIVKQLCPRHAATLGWDNERGECIELDHIQLSGPPRLDSQFSRSLIASLIEISTKISSDSIQSPSNFAVPHVASLIAGRSPLQSNLCYEY